MKNSHDPAVPGRFNASLALGILESLRYWALWDPRRIVILLRKIVAFRAANKKRALLYAKEGLLVPPLIIQSVTMRCNLSCAGCYSRDYSVENELQLTDLDNVFAQARELGVHFFVLTGGEPLMREGLTDLLLKHDRLTFLLFTNSTLIDEAWVKRVARAGNIVPLLSIEGAPENTDARRGAGMHDRVLAAMRLLNGEKCLFGFSTMVCRSNMALLCSEAYYDSLMALGCRIGFLVNYVPSSSSADIDNVASAEEQTRVRDHVVAMQRKKRLILIHMPDDEFQNSGSCMAAGAGFVHINAQGFVEPCPFSHFSTHSVKNTTLKDSLRSPLFEQIRNTPVLLQRPHLGCSLFEHRDEVAKIAERVGAHATD